MQTLVLIQPVNAFSQETLTETYGIDTNDHKEITMPNGLHIFAADDQLLIYDNDGELEAQYVQPSFTWTDSQMYEAGYRTSLLPWNDTFILVGHIAITIFKYGQGGTGTIAGYHIVGVAYQLYLLNVNSRSATTVTEGYKASTYQGMQAQWNGTSNLRTGACMLYTLEDGTYTSIYLAFGAAATTYRTGYTPSTGDQTGIRELAYCFTNQYGEIITSINTEIYHDGLVCDIHNSILFIPSETDTEEGYLICGNADEAARYSVFKVDMSSLTDLGDSGLDYTYAGNYRASDSTGYIGFVFKIGTYYYAAQDLYEVNIAYSYSVHALGIETIMFNDTSIDQEKAGVAAINTDSYFAMPYTVGLPTGGGNVSGVYSVAFWSNIPASDALTGASWTLSGIETGNPSWAAYQYGFLFTPQWPQAFNYTTATNMRGFQPLGSAVGIEIFGALAPVGVQGATVGQLFYNLEAEFVFAGLIQGGIFVNPTQIAYYPTEITLQQSLTYHFYGITYVNGIQNGQGNYTLYSTGTSILDTIVTTGTYSQVATGQISGGTFDFSFAPRVASTGVVFEGYKIQVWINEFNAANYTYYFGWYQPGGSHNGLTPYPAPPGGSPIGGGGVIDSNAYGAYMTVFVAFFMLFICIGAPILILGSQAGLPGLIVGSAMAISIGVLGGLIPYWVVLFMGVAVAAAFLMWRKNNGQG